jgi:leucyl/phenylalanyl-tRNA---protein transferase
MSLRHAVLVRQISRFAFFGADLSLARNTAFQLRLHFLTAPLFERISAATGEDCTADHEQDRHVLHLHILGMKPPIASLVAAFVSNAGKEMAFHRNALQFLQMIDPELLLQGYRLGIFPMAMEDGAIEWFSPDPRAILPLENFHVPHALRRLVRKEVFETTMDNRFVEVIAACAARKDTWINREIIESYARLHELGHAHSVEAWMKGKLAGGLYGVAIGGAFFGESMFHRVTDASKIALVSLVEHLRTRKFALLDTQWLTPHLEQFGGIEISRNHYLRLLRRAVELPREFV